MVVALRNQMSIVFHSLKAIRKVLIQLSFLPDTLEVASLKYLDYFYFYLLQSREKGVLGELNLQVWVLLP